MPTRTALVELTLAELDILIDRTGGPINTYKRESNWQMTPDCWITAREKLLRGKLEANRA